MAVLARCVRTVAALTLVGAGALLHAASWQRWAGVCRSSAQADVRACDLRQDHLYDFLVVAEPWEPIGSAAQQAGVALLLVAFALLLAPWALLVRPGRYVSVALVVAALAYAGVGVATLRSGLAGEVVDPLLGDATFSVWLFVPTLVLIWAALLARGWARAAAAFWVVASPLVMAFSYAIGPFDANPWYEAICGDLTVIAGVCLLVAAVWPARTSLSAGSGPSAGAGRRAAARVRAVGVREPGGPRRP